MLALTTDLMCRALAGGYALGAFNVYSLEGALAVCIGNVHGRYPGEPRLDFDRLVAIRKVVRVPLVLHGVSGLPDGLVQRSIELGICKFNVNTEVRQAGLDAARECLGGTGRVDLLNVMQASIEAMQAVVASKLELFGSTDKG
ncbi:MAG: class II fructose-bisphosphate aldolase [Anaerolineales bacterium]|nr:class II fructose-bisphosphate aldolase [Anaerolineales bacterium]